MPSINLSSDGVTKNIGTEVTQNLVLKGVDLTAQGNSDTVISTTC